MWLPRMSVPTRGRGKKICSLRRLSLRNSFAVRSVCLCQRKSWTREATLMYYLAIIFLFGAAYVHCLRFLPSQLTPIKKKHKEKVKTSWKSGLGFSPRFRSFEEGWDRRREPKKVGIWAWLNLRTIGWSWLGDHLKEITLQNDVTAIFIYAQP